MPTHLPLPALLLTHSATPITTPAAWQQTRRPELLELFRHHVFGRSPASANLPQLAFTLEESSPTAMNGRATRKQISLHLRGPHGAARLPFLLFIANHRPQNTPAPTFLYISIGDRTRLDPTRQIKSPAWPAETLIDRGYATAAFHVNDLAPNLPPKTTHDFRSSIHALFDPPAASGADALVGRSSAMPPRPPDAWATLAAWAWGASRIMDYLVTDPAIDPTRIALVCHPRAGKTALWSAAQDERFALAIAAQSGCSGAALNHHKNPNAETIANINTSFPHWFCDNYKNFNHREPPFDQHMLLALLAPRLLYVSSAAEDTWADPPNEFAACVHASPAWQLFGHPALENASFHLANAPLHDGPLAYHLRPGPHALTPEDWHHYLNFADSNWPK